MVIYGDDIVGQLDVKITFLFETFCCCYIPKIQFADNHIFTEMKLYRDIFKTNTEIGKA